MTGIKIPKKQHSAVTKKMAAQQHINEKISVKELALKYGVKEPTIRNWVNEYVKSIQVQDDEFVKSIKTTTDAVFANIVPTPLVYSLEEGASVAKISLNQLLHYAVLGKITLFFDRPADLLAIPKESVGSFSRRPGVMYRYQKSDTLQNKILEMQLSHYKCHFLAVSQNDCKHLEMGLSINKYKFHDVYWVDKNNNIMSSELNIKNNNEEIFHTLEENLARDNEGIDLEKDSYSIHIYKKMLKVSSKELDQLIRDEVERKAKREGSQELFCTHENKSCLLVDLDQAAYELWGDFNPIKAAVFSSQDEIVKYLTARFKFYEADAKSAALVLLPSIKNPILSTTANAQGVPYRPQMLSILVKAWIDLCFPKKYAKEEKILYNGKADEWLSKNLPELIKHRNVRLILAKIISSDNAGFQKKRKSTE